MIGIINTLCAVIQALYFAKQNGIWGEKSAQFLFDTINE